MIVRELITKLGFNVDLNKLRALDAAVDNSKRNVQTLTNKMQKVGDGLKNIGRNMTLFATVPILGLGGALIKVASDAEETESKFNTVFKNVGEAAEAASENLIKNFGLSRKASKQLLGDTGDLLTGFDFSQKAALGLSKQVNELAVDLASFTNFSGGAEGASKALTKALLGERESVKSLGIAILEEDVKKKVAEMRSRGLTFETERQAKAYATLEIALGQSKNAIGDFARTQDQFANRFRKFKARLADIAGGFGKLLLPMANKVIGRLIKLLDVVDDFSPQAKKMILIFFGLVAAVGPLLFLLGFTITTIAGLILKFMALKAAIIFFGITLKGAIVTTGLFAAKFLIIAAAIALAVIALATFVEDIYVWTQGGDSLTGRLLGPWEDWKNGLLTILDDVGQTIENFFVGLISGNFDGFLKDMEHWSKTLKFFFESIVDDMSVVLGDGFGRVLKKIGREIIRFVETMSEITAVVFNSSNKVEDIGEILERYGYDRSREINRRSDERRALTSKQNAVANSLVPAAPPVPIPSLVTGFGSKVDVNSNINLSFPVGTADDQINIVDTHVKRVVKEEITKSVNEALVANPVRE